MVYRETPMKIANMEFHPTIKINYLRMKLILSILLISFCINPIVTRHDKEEETFYINSSDYPSVVHPDFEGYENDIALIQLDRPVKAIEPIPLFSDTTEIGNQIKIVGRGWSGTGLTGPNRDDKKFRIATNKIDSVSYHWIKFRFDEPDNPNTTELEGISGPGDSGGPAFIELDGQKYIAGISSNQLNEQIGVEEGHYGVIEYDTYGNKDDWQQNCRGSLEAEQLADRIGNSKLSINKISVGVDKLKRIISCHRTRFLRR